MAPEPEILEAPTAALHAAIRGATAPDRMTEDFEAFLREQGVEGDDLQELLEVGARRMLVYRRLVHNRFRNTAREFIPRTIARLGRPRFAHDMDAFLEDHAARSPYLRDLPAEFVEWVVPRWRDDPEVPRYLCDLARHELLDIDVRNDWRGGEEPTGLPLALDRPLRFDGAARLIDYDFAVHRLSVAIDDRSEPDEEPTRLLVYRDEEHRPRYLTLTPFAAALLRALLVEGLAVQPGLMAACEALGEPLDDDKLASAAQLFADLGERGVCLGAEPA